MPRSHVLALILVLLGLWGVDRSLAPKSSKGSEYGLLVKQSERLATKPRASILVLGQSTTGTWLTPANLGRLRGVSARRVLDAHLSGCHPDCTYAEVRELLSQGRHFKEIFFGVNLFTLCEGEPRRRVASQLLNLPVEDTFLMARHYFDAEEPTAYLGALAALSVSHAYRDPEYVQRRLVKPWINPKSKPKLWIEENVQSLLPRLKVSPKERSPDRSCSFEPEAIAFKAGVLRALMADLNKLGDRVYLMALPDRTLSVKDAQPEHAKRWAKFLGLLRETAAATPNAVFLDLATRGPKRRGYYRDAFHLSPAGMRYQNRVLKRLLRRRRR